MTISWMPFGSRAKSADAGRTTRLIGIDGSGQYLLWADGPSQPKLERALQRSLYTPSSAAWLTGEHGGASTKWLQPWRRELIHKLRRATQSRARWRRPRVRPTPREGWRLLARLELELGRNAG